MSRASRAARTLRMLGHYEWFARLGRAMMPIDRALGRLTKGRFVAFGQRELPSLLIITTGRRSGKPRTVPLLYMPDGDAYVVMASNWGQPNHPAWAVNLRAHPDAIVMVGGRTVPVRARMATGTERDRLLGLMLGMWPAYATYQERASARSVKIFRLDPVLASDPG